MIWKAPLTHADCSAPNNGRRIEELCPHCGGLMLTEKVKADARKRGNASRLKSLQPGELSMADRGRRGGNPKNGGYTGPQPNGR